MSLAEVGQPSLLQDHYLRYYTYSLYFTISTVATSDGTKRSIIMRSRHLNICSTSLAEVDYLPGGQTRILCSLPSPSPRRYPNETSLNESVDLHGC